MHLFYCPDRLTAWEEATARWLTSEEEDQAAQAGATCRLVRNKTLITLYLIPWKSQIS